MELRALKRSEIEQVWTIDRREIIENLYTLRGGKLVLHAEYFDVPGWEEGEAEKYTPLLQESFDRGGKFFGFFDGDTLAGVGAVDTIWRGPGKDLLQLSFLHVGNDYRGRRLGMQLFEHCKDIAREMGARGLYVSAFQLQPIQFLGSAAILVAAAGTSLGWKLGRSVPASVKI